MTRKELEVLFLKKHTFHDIISIEDCENLDKIVRKEKPNDFATLSDTSLELLHGALNSIESQYKIENSFWYLSTPKKRIKHARDVIKNAEKLLSCFDLHAESRPVDLNPGHTLSGGIFADFKSDPNNLIQSLTELINLSKQRVLKEKQHLAELNKADAKEQGKSSKPQKSKKLYYRHSKIWLIGRLAIVYRHFWGEGEIGNTVYDHGGGGPAIRFLMAAANIICVENSSANTISYLLKIAPSPEEINRTGDPLAFSLMPGN